jgi:hypothetical protein
MRGSEHVSELTSILSPSQVWQIAPGAQFCRAFLRGCFWNAPIPLLRRWSRRDSPGCVPRCIRRLASVAGLAVLLVLPPCTLLACYFIPSLAFHTCLHEVESPRAIRTPRRPVCTRCSQPYRASFAIDVSRSVSASFLSRTLTHRPVQAISTGARRREPRPAGRLFLAPLRLASSSAVAPGSRFTFGYPL